MSIEQSFQFKDFNCLLLGRVNRTILSMGELSVVELGVAVIAVAAAIDI